MTLEFAPFDRPILLAFGGPAGSGKTTIARLVAPALGPVPPAAWLNTDGIRKEIANVRWDTRLGPHHYTIDARRRVYEEIGQRAYRALMRNCSAIWDASFQAVADRRFVESIAGEHSAPFLGLFFNASLDVRCQRVSQRPNNPSDADEEYIRHREHSQLLDKQEVNWLSVDANGTELETLSTVHQHISGIIKHRTAR